MSKEIEKFKDSAAASIYLMDAEEEVAWETARYCHQDRRGNRYKSSRCISVVAEDNYDEESNPF